MDRGVKWTKEQEDYLRKNYGSEGSKLTNVLPFTPKMIRRKAAKIGVGYVSPTQLPKLSNFDLGYIAAFLDGEGSVTYSSSASTRIQFRIKIANSDQDVIFWLREVLGIGKVRMRKARKYQHLDAFEFILERQGDVWGFLEMIHPYLKIKKQKSIDVLNELERRYKKEKSLMISGG